MELRQLRCFMAVVEEGGFNRSTTRLHMTQPAISYQIKLLEADLGMPLFYRLSRGISPTEAGRGLYPHALKIEDSVPQAQQALERLSDGVAGRGGGPPGGEGGGVFLPPPPPPQPQKKPPPPPPR
ncbi:LysR family transcriptional regulator, partial [bacterium]|nr:LysR family transcriptional regulator [bacterium]